MSMLVRGVANHSHISLVNRLPNANTRLAVAEPRIAASELDAAFARAIAWGTSDMPCSVRLSWFREDEAGFRDLPATPGAFAVVGRHRSCDVVLEGDPAMALRHLLVRGVLLEDGSIATRVLDLRTNLGFHLDDDAERRAIVVTGPFALRVGRYALVAVPAGATPPALRPRPVIIDAPCLPTGTSRRHITSVTAMPPAPMLEDIRRDVAAPGFARITLRRDEPGVEAWASAALSQSALDAGVLLGRADRCEGALKRVLNPSISRTHLLLLREHGLVHAFDLASTQGVYAGGERVRRVRLPDHGASLRLGSMNPVMLEWHPRAS
jgi:hypothetical protein